MHVVQHLFSKEKSLWTQSHQFEQDAMGWITRKLTENLPVLTWVVVLAAVLDDEDEVMLSHCTGATTATTAGCCVSQLLLSCLLLLLLFCCDWSTGEEDVTTNGVFASVMSSELEKIDQGDKVSLKVDGWISVVSISYDSKACTFSNVPPNAVLEKNWKKSRYTFQFFIW